jgi:ketosteroid isomerase-like protein
MSRENVEYVRRWVELWNSGDLEAFGAIHRPDVVVLPPDSWPDGEVSRGRDAWVRQVMRIKDSWKSDRIEPPELEAVGDNVIMRNRWTTRGKDSGIDFETQFYVVFSFSERTIKRIEFFLERARALEAAGLSEQDAHTDS